MPQSWITNNKLLIQTQALVIKIKKNKYNVTKKFHKKFAKPTRDDFLTAKCSANEWLYIS